MVSVISFNGFLVTGRESLVDGGSLELASAYIACGETEKGVTILQAVEKNLTEYVKWYLSLSNTYFVGSTRDCNENIYRLAAIQDTYSKLSHSETAKAGEYAKKAQSMDQNLQTLYGAFISKCESAGIQLQ